MISSELDLGLQLKHLRNRKNVKELYSKKKTLEKKSVLNFKKSYTTKTQIKGKMIPIFQMNKELVACLLKKKRLSWFEILTKIEELRKLDDEKHQIYLERKLAEEKINFFNKFQKKFIRNFEVKVNQKTLNFRLEEYNSKSDFN